MRALIIGAGMAGLSAAWHLQRVGVEATVLEARDRVGGRVWTNRDFADIPLEFGAELIHGKHAAVNTWDWVRKLGLKTWHWNKRDDSMIRTEAGEWLSMGRARAADPELEQTRSWQMTDAPAPRDDENLASYLRRSGFSDAQMRYVQRTYGNAEGESLRRLNARAYSPLSPVARTGSAADEVYGDYRILDGYDAYYDKLAESLDIRLNCPVRAVKWSDGVRVETASGQGLAANAAVVTLPLGVLEAGRVKFDPPLPAIKREALEGLKMGPVMKLIYRFDSPILDPSIGAIYARGNPPMWWSPSLGRGAGAIVWTAFATGDYARELMALGEDGAWRRGLETLRAEIGQPDLRAVAARWVNWRDDEFALGGYSVCLPGHYSARDKLAEATPPLFWAGEASAPHELAATAHGAFFTGRRAAEEIVEWRGAGA